MNRVKALMVFCILLALAPVVLGQRTQTELSVAQRLDVMTSKLESMRRELNSALSSMNTSKNKEKDTKPNADDPVVRLKGLEKEVSSTLSEVHDIRGKHDRAEKYDPSVIDRLEATVTELAGRVESGLQATASERTGAAAAATSTSKKKKKGKFLGLFGGGEDKYADLTGAAVAGRDRVLFEEAAKEVRKGRYDTGRLLFSTIINTYPDSPFLALAKLAIADSFFLEGTTSALIQAAQGYQDWLTFFPTDPLADDAMLKVAEAEMRQMGLSDRDITHARKAEQRLKVLMQQYPKSALRPVVEARLEEVQENLAMHNLAIARYYWDVRYKTQKGGLKGAQSRLKEVVDKYPCFSYNDEVLFRLASTYQAEEEPDEAAKYYQQLIIGFPESQYNEKAREQLNIIGAPIPEKSTPNPCTRKDHPGLVGSLWQQVSGRADVTVDKNGILISRDSKEGSDLIDQAIKYNGSLPVNVTPPTPVQRSTRPLATPAKTQTTNNGGAPAAPSPTPPGARP
ncbi:MAG TPA: outer membrane protein assembly factor BamD [Pyrinomonadaceae bacterium]|nr:outer membrane protein assembly factor BamD [Pyrinomonadaceae bacterium]